MEPDTDCRDIGIMDDYRDLLATAENLLEMKNTTGIYTGYIVRL